MEKTLSVAAIEAGTVIDHIQAGSGLRIVRLLKLTEGRHQVTLGLNLPSKSLEYKDLIKVEGREITIEEANQIALFAPKATINIIRDFRTHLKFKVSLPERVKGILHCPNERCVTNHEELTTHFRVERGFLSCYYCEKRFAHEKF